MIGKKGKDIPESQALDHVAGYFLALDMTAKQFIVSETENIWDCRKSLYLFIIYSTNS